MKKLSIKMRIAVFTGIMVIFTAVVLTLVSMYSAKKQITIALSEYAYNDDFDAGNNENITDLPNDGYFEINIDPQLVENASRSFNLVSVLSMAVIILLGMICAYIFADKALMPVKKLSKSITNITEKNLDTRIEKGKANDEISALTEAFNSMLDRLDEAFIRQKRFSSNAAHELKTPVAIIKTSIQTLENEEKGENDELEEVIEIIRRNTERLGDIIDDLMTLTNENELPKENVSINALIIAAVRDLMPAYKNKNIQIIYDLGDKELFTECSETLAYRLFYNLIENAMKYNVEDGSIRLSLIAKNNKYRIEITDSGIGISDKSIDSIWEAFYCVDDSRSRKYGGSGLGLSVVKEIGDKFGWDISVESKEGAGSTFAVEISEGELF